MRAAARLTLCVAALSLTSAVGADGPPRFVRSGTEDGLTSFETGTRVYRARDGSGTSVSLVGVVHIGDASYYGNLVDVLERHDLVLFESVLPRGAFGTAGSTDLERQRSTEDAMLFLRKLLAEHAIAHGEVPASMAELRGAAAKRDSRMARPIDLASVDAWGRPLEYSRVDGPFGFRLASLGADGAVGGRGFAMDLVLTELPSSAISKATGGGRSEARRDLYGDLAEALGTSLQVRSIDYDRRNWVPADLPMEELLDRLWKRGERSMTLEMLSAQDGLGQGILRFFLSLVSKSPGFKKMVIESLGGAGEAAGRRGRSGLGAVDERIILDERNEAVIQKLRETLSRPAAPKSVAIFYGAAHMGDFDQTLREEFSLEPVETHWFQAMAADEWSPKRIDGRIERLEAERTALIEGDPNGCGPAMAMLDRRLDGLRARRAGHP